MIAMCYEIDEVDRAAVLETMRRELRRVKYFMTPEEIAYDQSVISLRLKQAAIKVGKYRIALKGAYRTGDDQRILRAQNELYKASLQHYKYAIHWRLIVKYLSH